MTPKRFIFVTQQKKNSTFKAIAGGKVDVKVYLYQQPVRWQVSEVNMESSLRKSESLKRKSGLAIQTQTSPKGQTTSDLTIKCFIHVLNV